MNIIITGKNIDITEGLKEAVNDKIGKLAKYFSDDTTAKVTLSVEKDRQKIEVTIPVKGNIIRSEQVSSDMYVSIDLVQEIIERQLKKYKNKLVDKKQNAVSFSQAFIDIKDYFGEHPENFYFLDMNSFGSFTEDALQGHRDEYGNFLFMGSWVPHSPWYAEKFERQGILETDAAKAAFEDNVYLGKGHKASSNGELVAKVVRLAKELGREIATPAEARQILGLKQI